MRHKSKQVRKRPISTRHVEPSKRSASSKVTQSTIASFHTLLKRQAALKRKLEEADGGSGDAAIIRASLAQIEGDMTRLGGLETYQQASKIGQSRERGGDSSHVLIKWMNELEHEQTGPLRMLEIGALTPDNYASCSKWLSNYPIDLHSQHPDILEQDFFQRPLPENTAEAFDVVSCSLVLNFVSSPRERGEMLKLIHHQLKPSESSLLFLVLPLPCIENSRYISARSLASLMEVVGFQLVKEKWRPGGKVGYWLWRWAEPCLKDEAGRWKRKVLEQDGPGRNNFAVIVE